MATGCPSPEGLLKGDAPIEKKLLDACIHCGLCLPACPTYLATGREMESPRGRIYLINLWASGQEDLSSRMAEHIESCLGCLGCQTACPSGVNYERILNAARPSLASLRPKRVRRLMRFVFSRLLGDYKKLRFVGGLLRLWQKMHGRRILLTIPGARRWAKRLNEWQEFLPLVPDHKMLPKQAWMSGKKEGQVQLFAGCVMDILYNDVNHACLRLLNKQRQVVYVSEQTCCGALAFHAGEVDLARELARKNIALLKDQPGTIVVTAAGCAAMLKGYGELLSDDPTWSEAAHEFSLRVEDVSQFLSSHEFASKPRRIEYKVAYHAACHLCHAQNVRTGPVELLATVEGITLIPLDEQEHCCGSAGIFNLTHTELSLKVLERKIKHIMDTGADILVTTNPGCMLHIESGLKRANSAMRVRHLAELLDEAYD